MSVEFSKLKIETVASTLLPTPKLSFIIGYPFSFYLEGNCFYVFTPGGKNQENCLNGKPSIHLLSFGT